MASAPVPAAPATISTPLQWAHIVEADLGVPVNANNDAVLTAWAAKEGGNWHNSAFGNVLGTTEKLPGSTPINSVGVQRYTSWTQGIQATVDMIKQGNMAGILAALKTGGSPVTTATAIGDSPWLNGHTSAPGTETAYGDSIIHLLGAPYNPAASNATPATGTVPGATVTPAGFNPLDPTGIGGDILGGLFGGVTGGAADIAGGLTKPIITWVDSFAIRAFLVVAGSIAIIVGLQGLFDSGSSSSSSSPGGSGGGGGTSDKVPATVDRSSKSRPVAKTKKQGKGAGGGVASDVESTAEGAAEAV